MAVVFFDSETHKPRNFAYGNPPTHLGGGGKDRQKWAEWGCSTGPQANSIQVRYPTQGTLLPNPIVGNRQGQGQLGTGQLADSRE